MGKGRRTKKEKIAAKKHQQISLSTHFSFKKPQILPVIQKPVQTIEKTQTNNYQYVFGDIKTTAISLVIISIINLVTFLLLKKNILSLRVFGL